MLRGLGFCSFNLLGFCVGIAFGLKFKVVRLKLLMFEFRVRVEDGEPGLWAVGCRVED